MTPAAKEVLAFWFAEENEARWFARDDVFDRGSAPISATLLKPLPTAFWTAGHRRRWVGWRC